MVRLALFTVVLLLAGTCRESAPGQMAPRFSTDPHWRLQFSGGKLALARDGVVQQEREAPDAVPYQVVTAATPALVTTVDSKLQMTTFAIAEEIHSYPAHLPLLHQAPLIALMAPGPVESPEGWLPDIVLLKPDGAEAWSGEHTALLWPAAGASGTAIAYVATGSLPGDLGSYQQLELAAIDAASGSEYWRTALQLPGPVADVELAALSTTAGMLLIQHGYLSYSIAVFKRDSGALSAIHSLTGQPRYTTILPGQLAGLADCTLTGELAQLAVIDGSEGAQLWTFELTTGSLEKQPNAKRYPASSEENPLPVAGSGSPGPANTPFPQRLLPAAGGGEWSIAPLLAEDGAVLLISPAGPAWWRN